MIEKVFWKNKKVFITGHTGFKGAWLYAWLLMMGAEVTGYALKPPTNPNLFELAKIQAQPNMKSIIGDVRNLNALNLALEECAPDIVFHMAAQPLVRDSYKDPVYTYETNVMGTVNLLESVREYCARHGSSKAGCQLKSVVNITTDKVYENKEWHWGYRENENLCGFDPYSNSKSCSELVTCSYKNSFFNDEGAPAISTARSGNVIGGGDFANDRIIPDCIRAAEKGDPIIVRNPYSTRPYQHVLDCLTGYLLLAEKQYEDKKKYEGNYNFGPDDKDCITTGELVDLFCQAWGSTQKWQSQHDGGPHEANFLKLDCSKSRTVLGWKTKMNIAEAVEKTVAIAKVYNNGDVLKNRMIMQIEEYL